LISGLQKRDFKWKFACDQQLIDDLGPLLLPTTLLPVSFNEAKALVHSNWKLLNDLENNLQKTIDTNNTSGGIFVKLPFMSPKDVAIRLTCTRSKRQFKERLESHIAADHTLKSQLKKYIEGETVDLAFSATIYRLWLDSLYASLEYTSAHDALEAIMQSSRCQEELYDSIMSDAIPLKYFKMALVVRPWIKIRPGFEFRIYVSNNKITIASQYEPTYYPEVWNQREKIQSKISDFVQGKVIPQLQYRLPSFVVDVVMTDPNFDCYVVELNPFAASSSACLFKWGIDRQKILIGPEEWRFAPPPAEGVPYHAIPDEWKNWIEEENIAEDGIFDWLYQIVATINN